MLLLLQAGIIHWDGFADDVDGVGEEVAPDGLVEVGAFFVFVGSLSGDDCAVGSLGVVVDVEIGDETSGVIEGWFAFLNVDDFAILVHS